VISTLGWPSRCPSPRAPQPVTPVGSAVGAASAPPPAGGQRRLEAAAWPDMFTNLHTAYAELTRAQLELQHHASELEDARDRFQQVIESMSEALFLLDRTGRVVRTNPAAATLLDADEASLLGQPFAVACGTNEIPATPWALLERAANGVLRNLDVEFRTRAGRALPVNLSCALVRDKRGKITGVLAVARDVTEQKEAEARIRRLNEDLQRRATELTAANRELEAFSYSVSHDLRSPLRSIDGFSRVLLQNYSDKLDEQGQDYLRRVRAASQRMAQLIDDLLNLSRVSRREMARERVDLSALARAILTDLQKAQPERQVDWVVADGLVATGDAGLLRIVLENLLGNAWKFTGKQPRGQIEFGVADRDGATAYFVRDNGAGFDMAYAATDHSVRS